MGRGSRYAEREGAGLKFPNINSSSQRKLGSRSNSMIQVDASLRWHDGIDLKAEQQVDRRDAVAQFVLQALQSLRVRLLATLMQLGQCFQPRSGGCRDPGRTGVVHALLGCRRSGKGRRQL